MVNYTSSGSPNRRTRVAPSPMYHLPTRLPPLSAPDKASAAAARITEAAARRGRGFIYCAGVCVRTEAPDGPVRVAPQGDMSDLPHATDKPPPMKTRRFRDHNWRV